MKNPMIVQNIQTQNNYKTRKAQAKPAFSANFVITNQAKDELRPILRRFNYDPDAVFAKLKKMVEEATKLVHGTVKVDMHKDKHDWLHPTIMFEDKNGKKYTKNKFSPTGDSKFHIQNLVSFENFHGNAEKANIAPIINELADLYATEHGCINNPFHIIHHKMIHSDCPLILYKNEEKIAADKKAKKKSIQAESPALRRFWRKYCSGLRLVANNSQ